ncbi:MAG: hypothetical protein M3388_18585 [Acidobacteriota bacterium]|nr:hypothetical protein [Acidobacteriota bacterium]
MFGTVDRRRRSSPKLNNEISRDLIVGIGGVGGYFGFKLAQKYSDGEAAKITFVARGDL